MNKSYIKDVLRVPRLPGLVLPVAALVPLLMLGNPAVALLVGVSLALVLNRDVVPHSSKLSKLLLQAAIVLLGLKLNVGQMWQINAQYSVFVVTYVLGAITVGLILGRLMRIDHVSSVLISAGTGICGGTTIASLAPILRARADQVGVSLAIVFLLNALALFVFPWIGHWLEMSQQQFGVWSALAIHDTSSVVATAAIYGEEAVEVATVVKLGRTLWLIPAVLIVSVLARQHEAKVRLPWFIVFFVLASVVGSILPMPEILPALVSLTAQSFLVIALFLVGTQINRNTLGQLKGSVLWHALVLWAVVAPMTLFAVLILVP